MIVRLTLVNQDPGASAVGLALHLDAMDLPVVKDSGTGFDADESIAWAWVDVPVTQGHSALRLWNEIGALGQQVRVEVVEP